MLTNPSVTETAATHTPGPWRIGEALRGYDFGIVKPIATGVIGIADIPAGLHHGEADANARLIAAAPELLDALRTILQGFTDGVFVRDLTHDAESDWARRLVPFITALNRAQAAIAKAEGVTR